MKVSCVVYTVTAYITVIVSCVVYTVTADITVKVSCVLYTVTGLHKAGGKINIK